MHRSKAKTVNCLTCRFWKCNRGISHTNKGDLVLVSQTSYANCNNPSSAVYKEKRLHKQKCVNYENL